MHFRTTPKPPYAWARAIHRALCDGFVEITRRPYFKFRCVLRLYGIWLGAAPTTQTFCACSLPCVVSYSPRTLCAHFFFARARDLRAAALSRMVWTESSQFGKIYSIHFDARSERAYAIRIIVIPFCEPKVRANTIFAMRVRCAMTIIKNPSQSLPQLVVVGVVVKIYTCLISKRVSCDAKYTARTF